MTAPIFDSVATALKGTNARFAVAFSGGGDSTALLHSLKDYPYPDAPHLALIVDHGLRPESRRQAEAARDFARTLGYDARVLSWTPGAVQAGLQEKARKARYALLGAACRAAGVRTLLTGHTQDDQAETLLMRYDRGTEWRGAAGMAAETYAPLWPELAGVSVLRPLLNMTRSDLRGYNRAHGLNWTEDPSNMNRHFTRIRARDRLRANPAMKAGLLEPVPDLRMGLAHEKRYFRDWAQAHVQCDPYGILTVSAVPPLALLGALLRISSGTGGPIERDALRRLKSDMQRPAFRGATLAGAQVVKSNSQFVLCRDPVAAKGRDGQPPRLRPTVLNPKVVDAGALIWDGRFGVEAHQPGYDIRPVFGQGPHFRKLLKAHPTAELAVVPACARPTLPMIFRGPECVACGRINTDSLHMRSLIPERLSLYLGAET